MPRIQISECKQEDSTFNPCLSAYDDQCFPWSGARVPLSRHVGGVRLGSAKESVKFTIRPEGFRRRRAYGGQDGWQA